MNNLSDFENFSELHFFWEGEIGGGGGRQTKVGAPGAKNPRYASAMRISCALATTTPLCCYQLRRLTLCVYLWNPLTGGRKFLTNRYSQIMVVIYLGEFAKSAFTTDIAYPHIKQHFLTCRQTVFLLFSHVQGVPKKTNLCF